MATPRYTSEEVVDVARHFNLAGEPVEAVPYGSGHINDTFLLTTRQEDSTRPWIMQRINHKVFPRPDQVMENIVRVTEHLRAKTRFAGGNPDREALTVIPTQIGRPYHVTPAGDHWRTYIFIEDAHTHDVLKETRQAYEAARAFGLFQRQLADLPAPPLHETIADFHHTPARFARLRDAVEADSAGRLASCGPEVEWALAQKPMTSVVVDGLTAGDIPWRVTHNDTKINNVMLDDQSGRGICVIDLDTVMPGSALYDFGDQVRTSVGHFAENEQDLNKVYADLDRFEALVRGYLETAGDFLVPREKELLPLAGILITYEIGIRFLTDYLQGDVYFKTHRPGENLDRARTQFKLVQDLQAKEARLREIANT